MSLDRWDEQHELLKTIFFPWACASRHMQQLLFLRLCDILFYSIKLSVVESLPLRTSLTFPPWKSFYLAHLSHLKVLVSDHDLWSHGRSFHYYSVSHSVKSMGILIKRMNIFPRTIIIIVAIIILLSSYWGQYGQRMQPLLPSYDMHLESQLSPDPLQTVPVRLFPGTKVYSFVHDNNTGQKLFYSM